MKAIRKYLEAGKISIERSLIAIMSYSWPVHVAPLAREEVILCFKIRHILWQTNSKGEQFHWSWEDLLIFHNPMVLPGRIGYGCVPIDEWWRLNPTNLILHQWIVLVEWIIDTPVISTWMRPSVTIAPDDEPSRRVGTWTSIGLKHRRSFSHNPRSSWLTMVVGIWWKGCYLAT